MNLCDYNTTETLREATRAEAIRSHLSGRAGGAGVIEVDGLSVYVEDSPEYRAIVAEYEADQ